MATRAHEEAARRRLHDTRGEFVAMKAMTFQGVSLAPGDVVDSSGLAERKIISLFAAGLIGRREHLGVPVRRRIDITGARREYFRQQFLRRYDPSKATAVVETTKLDADAIESEAGPGDDAGVTEPASDVSSVGQSGDARLPDESASDAPSSPIVPDEAPPAAEASTAKRGKRGR
jgi:hypothetical protein